MGDETILDESTLRENLKKARTVNGYTQAEIAESLEISVTAYQNIESGKTRILNRNYSRCAGKLGLSLSELVNGFKPIKDAEAALNDVKESYGLKMRVLEQGYAREIQNREREIERLKERIKDKDDTIASQKLLIDELMGRLGS